MNGILLIDKPKDWTSFDVVAKTRGIIRRQTGIKKPKVGHAGTLDPMATGLLIVLVGSYCKQAAKFLGLDKSYQAEITLGAVSTTGDAEGTIAKKNGFQPDIETVQEACQAFTGSFKQLPPAHSAKKVNGKRAYQLAREGKTVTLEPKQITIYDITIVDYNYPVLKITTQVSSGTYLRSLAVDIGEKLRTGGYLSSLRRTQIGNFPITDAISIGEIDQADDVTAFIKQPAIDKA